MITKVCSKCKVEKALTGFGKRQASSDGFRSQCKLCDKEDKLKYRKINAKKVRAYMANWRKKNKEKVKEDFAIWAKNNQEQRKERLSNWRKKNKDKEKEWRICYYKNNREDILMSSKVNIINLSDSYVRSKLKLTKDQATPELIELKRTHLQISRYLKESKK